MVSSPEMATFEIFCPFAALAFANFALNNQPYAVYRMFACVFVFAELYYQITGYCISVIVFITC